MSFTLQEGTLFAGRYRILRCIATGGMGAVYEVLHIETERRRALKVMLPHLFKSPDLRERFKREARVAAQIDSEFIVDVFDAGVDPATEMPFLVMELLRGEELGARLERIGRMEPHEVILCLHQTALALDRTHQASIVHRDLKPENLFLVARERGPSQIKVLDFGVAKFIAENTTQSSATMSVGTPYYMSPEQFRSGFITHAADLYALGMMGYTLLVGEPYWADEARQASSLFAFSALTTEGPKELPSARAARYGVSLPPAFDAWFQKATAFEPIQRFPTATATVEALADALGLGSLLGRASPAGAGAPWWPGDASDRVSGAPASRPSADATGPARSSAGSPAGRAEPAVVIGAATPSVRSSGSPSGVELATQLAAPEKKRTAGIPAALIAGSFGVGAALALAMYVYALRAPGPAGETSASASPPAGAALPAAAASPAPAPQPAGPPEVTRAVVVEPAASGSLAPAPQAPAASTSAGPESAPAKARRMPGPSASPPAPAEAEPIYTRD
jgi:eukaryotic-like serine/threonine-protein kinase